MRPILKSFMELGDNWDGYGGIPTLLECAQNANDILNNISEAYTDIMPNPHGTVTIDWDNGEDLVSLEIGVNDYSFFVKMKNSIVYTEESSLPLEDYTNLKHYINQVMNH